MIDADDLEQGFSPTCTACLTAMVPTEHAHRPVWECASCGIVRIS